MAVVNFYGKYKQLPGDSNIVEPHGNKNGKITDSVDGGVDVCGQEECEEPMFFWFQLSELAMINHPYNHDFANNMKPQTNVPNVTIGTYQDGLYVGYNAEDEGILGAIGNFYDIGGSKEIKMIDVIAIENKLDDGSPSTGIIRAVDNADEECTIDSVGGVCSNLYITIGGRTGIN